MRHAHSAIPSNACHFKVHLPIAFLKGKATKGMHEKLCNGSMCQYFSVFLAYVMPRKELKMQRLLLLQPKEEFTEGYCLLFLQRDKKRDFLAFFLLLFEDERN